MRHVAIVMALSALCWGCVLPTIHPLFTEADVVFDPALLGTWAGEGNDSTWTFARGEGKSYRMTFTDGEESGVFVGHLAKLGEYRFLDIVPDAEHAIAKSLTEEFVLPLHLFARVDAIGTTVEIAVIDLEWVKKHLEANPKALAHTKYKDGILVTASTKELRAFLLLHAANPDAFEKISPYRKADVLKTLPPYASEVRR